MKPRTIFDCVEMKTSIQEQLLREIAELGEEEAAKRRKARVLRDPILSPLLQPKGVMRRRPMEHEPAAR
jgi:hypothetical protein